MTNELSSWTSTLTAVFQQMYQWPVAVLLCACLNVLGVWLKWLPNFPNRLIPPTLVVLGAIINCLAGETGRVAPDQRHPYLILVMGGDLHRVCGGAHSRHGAQVVGEVFALYR